MPPVNSKAEALRLQQAKLAILKMKKKRQEIVRLGETTRTPVKAKKSTIKGSVPLKLSVQPSGNLNEMPLVEKKKVPMGSVLTDKNTLGAKKGGMSSKPNGHIASSRKPNKAAPKEDIVPNFDRKGMCDTVLVKREDDNRQRSVTRDPVKFGSKLVPIESTPEVPNGSCAPSALFKSETLTKKKKPPSSHISAELHSISVKDTSKKKKLGVDLDSPDLPYEASVGFTTNHTELDIPPKLLKRTPRKVKRLKRVHLRKLNKSDAPMSLKMKPKKVKELIFAVSPDNTHNASDIKPKGSSCAQVSVDTPINHSSKPMFSITTVSENVLPFRESVEEAGQTLSDQEDEHVDEELSHSGSGDDFEDIEDESKIITPKLYDKTKVKFYFEDGLIVLHLEHPATFVFCGQVQLEVLKGAVEILGFHLTPSNGCQTVFSPRASSLLTVQTILSDHHSLSNIVLENPSLSSLIALANENDAFILLRKAEGTLPLFLEKYVNIRLFPHPPKKKESNSSMKASRKLDCLCYPPRGSIIFQKGEMWDDVYENIAKVEGCSVLIGGKGVGKSSLLRFLTNRLLSEGREDVLLIDFDPGQAELTVPGCVSISLVTEPLLGPNFTHLQNPLKCIYIGDVNVSNCVSRYMDACLSIINYWQSNENLKGKPCLVNTMGFNKGIGVTIMVQILSLIQPTTVIQIQSEFSTRNYPELLTVEYVKRLCSSSPFRLQLSAQGRQLPCPSALNFDLSVVASATDFISESPEWGLSPRNAREIVLLSYLSQMAKAPSFSLLDVVPFFCPMDSLYLSICHENVPLSATLSAFNANLVALCCVDPEKENAYQYEEPHYPLVITGRNNADCLGFGIVRGVDVEYHQLYLLTPVPPEILESVNCLMLGAVSLPPSIYLSSPKEPGLVPFVITSFNQYAAQPSVMVSRLRRLTRKH